MKYVAILINFRKWLNTIPFFLVEQSKCSLFMPSCKRIGIDFSVKLNTKIPKFMIGDGVQVSKYKIIFPKEVLSKLVVSVSN